MRPLSASLTQSDMFLKNRSVFQLFWCLENFFFSISRRRWSSTSNITFETDSFDLIFILSWSQVETLYAQRINISNEIVKWILLFTIHYSCLSITDHTQSIFNIRHHLLLAFQMFVNVSFLSSSNYYRRARVMNSSLKLNLV